MFSTGKITFAAFHVFLACLFDSFLCPSRIDMSYSELTIATVSFHSDAKRISRGD